MHHDPIDSFYYLRLVIDSLLLIDGLIVLF
jgi:hypothetical protein